MDLTQFFTASRAIIVAGKGGVGKTTVSATIARAAARRGLKVLLVDLEGKNDLPRLFGSAPFGYDVRSLRVAEEPSSEIGARLLTPDASLLDYLNEHGMARIGSRMVATGVLDIVATATPGIRDLLVLGKIRQLEKQRAADLIVVDAPAAGHAIAFLRSPRGVLDSVGAGPIRTQAQEALDLLSDASRAIVVLVTLPEETPVNELTETAAELQDTVGVALGPVVVNGCWPDPGVLPADVAEAARAEGFTLDPAESASLSAAAAFRRERQELQTGQLERLATLSTRPLLQLPHLFTPEIRPGDLATLVDSLEAGIRSLPTPSVD